MQAPSGAVNVTSPVRHAPVTFRNTFIRHVTQGNVTHMAKFRVCKGCGKAFETHTPNTEKRYCCNACRQRAYRNRQPRKPTQRARFTFGERRCEVCESSFTARHAHQRFCCHACRQWLWRNQSRLEMEYVYANPQ